MSSILNFEELKKLSAENIFSQILSNGFGFLTFMIMQNFFQTKSWKNLWGFAFWKKDTIFVSQFVFDSVQLFIAATSAFIITKLISRFKRKIKSKTKLNNNILKLATGLNYNSLGNENFIDAFVSFFSGFMIFEIIKQFIEPKGFFNLWGFAFWKKTLVINSFYFSILEFILPAIIGSVISLIVITLIKHKKKLMLIIFILAFSSLHFLL